MTKSSNKRAKRVNDKKIIEASLKYIKGEIARLRRRIDGLELRVDLISGKYIPAEINNPRWVSPFYTNKDDCNQVRIHIGDTVKVLTGETENSYGIVTRHSKARVYIRDRAGTEISRSSKHLEVVIRRS